MLVFFVSISAPSLHQMINMIIPCITISHTCLSLLLGGIIQHHCTDTDINHAVQITGYDFNGKM